MEARDLGHVAAHFHPLEDLFGNCYIKRYPDGSAKVIAAERAVFRAPGFEAAGYGGGQERRRVERLAGYEWDPSMLEDEEEAYACAERGGMADDNKEVRNRLRAQRRAKTAVEDLCRSNDFRWFVTLTLDGAKVDRYDVAAVTRKLNAWLSNRVQKDGLRYVLVAERHKDGAIHFHGFMSDSISYVDSGTIAGIKPKPAKPRSAKERARWLEQGGHVVYNLPAWTLGYTTAIELYGERRAAIGYVVKYITKAQDKVGGRWYYSGGALRRPEVEVVRVDFGALLAVPGAYSFLLGDLGCRCCMFETGPDGTVMSKGGKQDVQAG